VFGKDIAEFRQKLLKLILATMEQEKDRMQDKNTVHNNSDIEQEVNESELKENQPGEIDRLTAELADSKEKYLRLYADFENLRRRTAKEKLEYIKSANEEIIKVILPVIDDFERAQKSNTNVEDANVVKEGMSLIYNKLYKTLEQKGLKPMESVGKNFDPDLHESITQIPAPTEELKGKVIDEVEKGFFLNDKVLRFAKVIIGS
jgi:molecular chaperone GrpE